MLSKEKADNQGKCPFPNKGEAVSCLNLGIGKLLSWFFIKCETITGIVTEIS